MTAPRFLARALRRSYDGGAWHGPSLAEVLAGVEAPDALARPVADAHTIWELVHHVAAWTREVERRLAGIPPAMPREGDWPEPADATSASRDAAAWDALRAELSAARDAVLVAVEAFPTHRLDERVAAIDDPSLGAGATWGQMLVGLAEHNAYHGGQIVLLRRLIDGSRLAGDDLPPSPDPSQITES